MITKITNYQPDADGWIQVSGKRPLIFYQHNLPKPKKKVMVRFDEGSELESYFYAGDFMGGHTGKFKVTHWKPIEEDEVQSDKPND